MGRSRGLCFQTQSAIRRPEQVVGLDQGQEAHWALFRPNGPRGLTDDKLPIQ